MPLDGGEREQAMSNVEQAVATFGQGFNCAQAVVSAYAPSLGLDRALALKLAGPFGGGIGRRGDICGAVTGALMALGLKYGAVSGSDAEGKKRCYEITNEFIRRFRQRNASIVCRDLLGLDLGTPEGAKLALERKVHTEVCPRFIRDAAEILDEMLSP